MRDRGNRTAETVFRDRAASVLNAPLRASGIEILQVNVGYRCNMRCKHCHVNAGPDRREMMDRSTAEEILSTLPHSDIGTLDITGGAPELNPHLRFLVSEARRLGRHVIVRSNLTVAFEEGMADLLEFYAESGAELIASLPDYTGSGVDNIRGADAFEKSVRALRILNALGYGRNGEDGLTLNLVHNPRGAFLSPPQERLEEEYRKELGERWGISFNRLYTFTNMPVGRFREFLMRSGNLDRYMMRLENAFNPDTLCGLMCRRLLNVGWDGNLYDCDFNQMIGLLVLPRYPQHIRDFSVQNLAEREIAVADHCFGCTAGQGST